MAPRTRAQGKRAREEEDEKRCRLCLEGEADGPLVQLCACRGSAKLVHRTSQFLNRRLGREKFGAVTQVRGPLLISPL